MRKAFAILVAFIIIALLAGCSSAPHTADDPAAIGEESWSGEYVQVSNGDVIFCLWQGKETTAPVMSCDWTPTDAVADSVVGKDSWEEEYVTVSEGKTVMCLWKSRETTAPTISCDWDE